MTDGDKKYCQKEIAKKCTIIEIYCWLYGFFSMNFFGQFHAMVTFFGS